VKYRICHSYIKRIKSHPVTNPPNRVGWVPSITKIFDNCNVLMMGSAHPSKKLSLNDGSKKWEHLKKTVFL